MTETQDDLTLVYMFGYKNGKNSTKDEIDKLREALRRIAHAPHGKIYCADGHEEAVLIARAALGEETQNETN
jgi:plasmid stabilization system protein ParE